MNVSADVVVVGGGAAGFFSAIIAKEQNPSIDIVILEQSKEVLNKVRISGGGRCNVTNSIWDARELAANYPRGEKELIGPFNKFGCGDTMAWYEAHGVPLKIEDDGRTFPASDSSVSIIDCLMGEVKKHGIKVKTFCKAQQILVADSEYIVHTNEHIYHAKKLVLGPGSSKSFWQMLEKMGYQIVKPVPSLFTFNIKDTRLVDLMGLSVPNAHITINDLGEESSGPLLITHWGLSGPGILKLSAWAARALADREYKFTIEIDWAPTLSVEDIRDLRKLGAKTVMANPQDNIPSRLWKSLLKNTSIEEHTRWADVNNEKCDQIIQAIKKCKFAVNGKSTFKEEFVTAGGVDLKQINFTTFESKLHPGLYMAGEVINIDAITGGFNFQAAWTGGFLIGKAIGTSL
jgi:predicted Rossmann fold flavoprotein